ncbi:MAG: hypothetical protein F6K63_25765 [Moorea sp. SIO1G6]|uniref:hypothetical protein n=1 Tax=unclassified Moorena TaxID=2683338 RepID=UPI0013B8E210|nr:MULTISPECIES: hypothetical protein [unclassified Moorena]NEQ07355.1 hypothetical protein [Moorena sp. SIO4E2]NEQ12613.1 hypothetical protein [Moorena sp. SIO3E2]NET67606.1 hypothetical protein [Moorena sp. SIO1G6]
MSKNFPPSDNQSPKPKKVKHFLVGSPEKVRHTINALYSLKYAYPDEWSTPEPTGKPGEVMTFVIRYFYID